MFSFGIEPSTTSTYGAPSVPSAAARNGAMNSSPPSVGESTLLCRITLGRPGIAPSSTSSSAGCEAAVTATESPSQLIPSDVHRMWTSSTAGADCVSTDIAHLGFLDLQLLDEQLVACRHHHVNAVARAAGERKAVLLAHDAARAAAHRRRHRAQLERGALQRRSLRQ